jgi:hypothetical protein
VARPALTRGPGDGNHKDYRYVPNNTGEQPTFRVADVDNPILQPWTRDALKKVNERMVRTGSASRSAVTRMATRL